MKRLILALILLAQPSYAVETIVIGAGSEGQDAGFANLTATTISTSGDVTVGGNLDVNGDGPHTVFANLTGTGPKIGFDFDCTVNLSSGNDTCFEMNVTDTASPGTSLIMDLQVGGSSKFKVDNSGNITIGGDLTNYNGQIQASGVRRLTNSVLSLQSGLTFSGAAVQIPSTMNASSGTNIPLRIIPTYNQSGTSGANDLSIERTETAIGSGEQNYIKATGGANDFRVDREGSIFAGGGASFAFSNVSTGNSPVTVTTSDYSFDCDASGGDVTFNLMSSSLVTGQGFEFSNTGASGKCFVNPAGSETLNGFTNYSGLDTQWESVLIRSNGTNWTIKAAY